MFVFSREAVGWWKSIPTQFHTPTGATGYSPTQDRPADSSCFFETVIQLWKVGGKNLLPVVLPSSGELPAHPETAFLSLEWALGCLLRIYAQKRKWAKCWQRFLATRRWEYWCLDLMLLVKPPSCTSWSWDSPSPPSPPWALTWRPSPIRMWSSTCGM